MAIVNQPIEDEVVGSIPTRSTKPSVKILKNPSTIRPWLQEAARETASVAINAELPKARKVVNSCESIAPRG
jgi:hypothetical protein